MMKLRRVITSMMAIFLAFSLSATPGNQVKVKGFLLKNLNSSDYSASISNSNSKIKKYDSSLKVTKDAYRAYDAAANGEEVHLMAVDKKGKIFLTSEDKYIADKDSDLYAVYEITGEGGAEELKFCGMLFESNAERKEVKLNGDYYPTPIDRDVNDGVDNVYRGFVEGTTLTKEIVEESGYVSWKLPAYSFIQGDSPETVHPVLWRMEKLNNVSGLFQVLPKVEKGGKDGVIYQVRGYDIATTSFIKGEDGWIIIDPMSGAANAAEAWRVFKENVDPAAKVSAIIITHSHVDHYNGVVGIVGLDDIWRVSQEEYMELTKDPAKLREARGEKTLVVAPDGFFDEAISENLYLGNSMIRRAIYMYGMALPIDQYGHIGSGLGKTASPASGVLIQPSFELIPQQDGLLEMTIDGLSFLFQNVPGTEAPAEFHVFCKDYKALCPGENVTQTMHNLLTSRGAKVRDAKAFAVAIDDAKNIALDYFDGTIDVIIGTHHWPTWGNEECLELLTKQRDMYYFFNNQVIHMINKGMNMEEIAEEFELPETLGNEFYNRGYYGTLSHDVKAVFQRYVGWWDGNPANYFKYPEVEAAKRYVSDMGGEDVVLKKAKEYFIKGDYRWTVEMTKQLVFNNPENMEARYLQADALEQLGYSFESGTWRNIFLTGAQDLRKPNPKVPNSMIIAFNVKNIIHMPAGHIFEYFSILLDGSKAGKDEADCSKNVKVGEEYFNLHLVNGVLHHKRIEPVEDAVVFADVKALVDDYAARMAAMNPDTPSDQSVEGNSPLDDFYKYFEIFNPLWNIIEPL